MSTDYNLVADMAKVATGSDFSPSQNGDKWLFTEMRRRVEDRMEIKRMKDELGLEELFFD
tara:strand:- start:3017 stop:3196 length:180 start_codon:yes stop_codon:yes gene_type:complete